MTTKSYKKNLKYIHTDLLKTWLECIFKGQNSFLYVWSSLLLILSGIITYHAFFYHSNISFLAFPLALKKEDEPSLTGIPKRDLHFILHYVMLELIKKNKQSSYCSSFSHKRNRYFLFSYHKNFRMVRRLKGRALCLLQTQYAKKPKNPV